MTCGVLYARQGMAVTNFEIGPRCVMGSRALGRGLLGWRLPRPGHSGRVFQMDLLALVGSDELARSLPGKCVLLQKLCSGYSLGQG